MTGLLYEIDMHLLWAACTVLQVSRRNFLNYAMILKVPLSVTVQDGYNFTKPTLTFITFTTQVN